MSTIFGQMKAKQLNLGFLYSIKGEAHPYIYVGQTRFLEESERFKLQVLERHIFSYSTIEGIIFKEFALKNVGSDGVFKISEEETDLLFRTYHVERTQVHKVASNVIGMEIAKFLLNPQVARYTKEKNIENSMNLFKHMQQILPDLVKEKGDFVFYRAFAPEKNEEFHREVIGAYIHLLFQLKNYLLEGIDTNQLSVKKLKYILFTKPVQDKLILWMEDSVSYLDRENTKEQPFTFKFSKFWLVESEKNYNDFLPILKKAEDNMIDFSKSYEKNKSNLIRADAFSGSHYQLFRLNTLFGDVYYLFCNIHYLNNLEYLEENVLQETFF